jgi:hypothetical protein
VQEGGRERRKDDEGKSGGGAPETIGAGLRYRLVLAVTTHHGDQTISRPPFFLFFFRFPSLAPPASYAWFLQ